MGNDQTFSIMVLIKILLLLLLLIILIILLVLCQGRTTQTLTHRPSTSQRRAAEHSSFEHDHKRFFCHRVLDVYALGPLQCTR